MTNWSAKKSSATQRSSFVLFDLSRGRMAEFSMTYSNERHHHYCSACAKVWGPPIDFFWRRRIVHDYLLVPLCLLFIEQSQHYFLVLFWRLKAWERYKSLVEISQCILCILGMHFGYLPFHVSLVVSCCLEESVRKEKTFEPSPTWPHLHHFIHSNIMATWSRNEIRFNWKNSKLSHHVRLML